MSYLRKSIKTVGRTLSGLTAALCLQLLSVDAAQALQSAQADTRPKLALAKVYHQQNDLSDYWVSEKLDGVRAYWDGQQLLSRSGNVYNAPNWFIQGFPDQILDGELWINRSRFEQLVSTVRKQIPVDSEWKQVKFMVFDLPTSIAPFSARLKQMQRIIAQVNNPFIELVEQSKVNNHEALMQRLNKVVASGGEGLMLHDGNALYRSGRTSDLLKVKRYQDAEATVIAHLPGQGKYLNMLGALQVVTENGKRFRLGTGFSDAERKNPPPIGSIVRYQFTGVTKNGIPKFASFLRIRQPITIQPE